MCAESLGICYVDKFKRRNDHLLRDMSPKPDLKIPSYKIVKYEKALAGGIVFIICMSHIRED
jgi:hypothetical protein